MPRLIILPKGQSVRQINIKGSLTTIGRKEGNSLLLDGERVSRNHAVIDWNGDHYSIIDTGSRNGTFVNGRRVQRQALRNGDMIRIGDCELRFLFDTRPLPEVQALRLVTIPGALADLGATAAAPRNRVAPAWGWCLLCSHDSSVGTGPTLGPLRRAFLFGDAARRRNAAAPHLL